MLQCTFFKVTSGAMSILRLAIPSPLRRLFDYLPPASLDAAGIAALQPGQRLRVPFGTREVTGYLLGVFAESEAPATSLKRATELLDSEPLIDATLLSLAGWAAEYYHHPPGEVYPALFPKRLREGRPHEPAGEPGWQLSARGKGLPPGALARSPKQSSALDFLHAATAATTATLTTAGISPGILRTLHSKGLIEPCKLATQTPGPPHCHPGHELNAEQASAVQALLAAQRGFSCHLIEGVTGSGKTEVYLQLIAACLQRGRQALVLIPEIGLTPQTLERFAARFSCKIVVLHSGLSETQRYRAWEAARDGSASIVIGTRSAVFTPLDSPGLIVVDEEHDASYKQQDGFRYNARDIAVKRGQLSDCPVLLGSATPSLESLHNALAGRYRQHRLLQRAADAELPSIEVLDVRKRPLRGGLSEPLITAVQECLARKQQALLFLNRRGYAPTLLCHDCGWVAGCSACDARLTVHRGKRLLRCHHCGAGNPLLRACPQCHSRQLVTTGLGTEQVESTLREHFPASRVLRVDSDSMQGREAMAALVEDINRGEPCILLGTQMLTKGHHFPAVSLVGVIDADALLFSADFRGEERMAQLLTQVSGRAGRAGAAGRVILQSHYPDHPGLQSMLHSSYAEQALVMLQQRRESGMPPVGQMLILRTDCADASLGEDFLAALRSASEAALGRGTSLIGPLPSPMQRRAGRFRCQLLAIAHNRAAAQAAADVLVAQAEQLPARRGLRWSIDIDPQDLF